VTEARDPEPTRPIDLGDATQPVEVHPTTGPFAPTRQPSRPIPLVSHTAANELITTAADASGEADADPADPTSGIDTLFGQDRFQEYDAAPPPAPPAAPAVRRSPPRPDHEPPHMTRGHGILLAVAGALVGLLGVAALFFLGVRLSAVAPTEPTHRHTASASPTPLVTSLPAGPVAAGTHRWDALLGGECLASFPGAWAERYTVVDCATPHPAQLVDRGWLPDPATPGYPGQAALQAQMSVLCSAPGVIDLAAAAQYSDAQIQASYPATAAQWDAGDHWYYCFVTRSSGEPLTGSVAAPADG